MTLDASIIGVHIVEASRVEYRVTRFQGHMSASRTVAPLTANIPFADGFGRNIVVHRMASVAKRSSWPLEIIRWVQRRPPVGSIRHEIAPPHFVRDVPLSRLREIIVADLGKISLLPAAAIDERYTVLRKAH